MWHIAATMRSGRKQGQCHFACSCWWTSCPALSSLGRTQNANASQLHWLRPSQLSSAKPSSPLHNSLKRHTNTHQHTNNSRTVNSRRVARRCWQQNKSDSRSCDKSETSSHLTAAHAVYELPYYFTQYAHSIPEEHRANKHLKDSQELHLHWNQTRAWQQPSETHTGNRTHPTQTKTHSIETKPPCTYPPRRYLQATLPHFSYQFLSLVWGSNSFRFSSSLGKLPESVTGGERELGGSPWSSSWILTVF